MTDDEAIRRAFEALKFEYTLSRDRDQIHGGCLYEIHIFAPNSNIYTQGPIDTYRSRDLQDALNWTQKHYPGAKEYCWD